MSVKLYELTSEYSELLEMLEDADADEEIIRDTLESIEGEIEEKADAYAAIMTQMNAEAEMLALEAQRLTKRATSLLQRSDRMKTYLQRQLALIGLKKLKTKYHNFTVRTNAESLVLESAADIPERFLVRKTTETIDRAALKKALQAGEDIPGARLTRTESLLIK